MWSYFFVSEEVSRGKRMEIGLKIRVIIKRKMNGYGGIILVFTFRVLVFRRVYMRVG